MLQYCICEIYYNYIILAPTTPKFQYLISIFLYVYKI